MAEPIEPVQGASYAADQPTANEQLLNSAIYHGLGLERVNAGMKQDIRKLLEQAQEQITGKLQSGKLTDWQTQKAQQFLDWSNKVIAKTYDKIDSTVQDNLDGIKEAEIAKQTNAVNSVLGVEMTPAMSTQQLESIAKADELLVNGAVMGDWWKKQAANLQHNVLTTVQNGLSLGQSTQDIATAIQQKMGPESVTEAQATTLARTAAATVQSEAQQAYYKENSDIMKGVRWVSTLDSRTTPMCQSLDGKTWQVDKKGILAPVGHDMPFPGYPPIHWNCRSTTVPVLKSWQELSKKELPHLDDQKVEDIFKQKLADQGFTDDQIAQIEMNQRASVDGAVPAATTYEQWLEAQPELTQKQILGPAKWQLWHDGAVSLDDMINKQTLEPLTVDELKAAAYKNQAIPAPPQPVEGKYGLTLSENQILTAQMTSGATSGEAWASWLNPDNGVRVDQVLKSSLNAQENNVLKHQDSLVHLTNSNSNTQFWNASDAKLWAGQPGFEAAKLVTPSGRVITAKLKPGKTWTSTDADNYAAKLRANRSRGMDEFRAQADALGPKMTVVQTSPGAISLDSSTMKKVYPPVHAEDKPLSFLEAHANLDQLKQDAELAQAHQAIKDQLKAADEAQQAYAEESQKAREAQAELQTKIAQRDLEAAAKEKEEADATVAAHEEAVAKAKAEAEAAAKALAEAKWKQEATEADEARANAAAAAQQKAQDELWTHQANQVTAQQIYDAQAAELAAKKAQEKAIKAAKAAAKKAAKLAKLQAAPVDTTGQMQLGLTPKADIKTNFPADPMALKVTKSLPGSTGAVQVQDKDGNLYVRKIDKNKGQVNDEFVADQVYAKAGINTPEGQLYSTVDGPVKLTKWVDGGKMLNDYLATASPVEKQQVMLQIRRGFVTDAWLGNWDVAGLNLDNILVDRNGTAWRIDNGGSLRYRGMGSKKTAQQFGNTVPEIDTLRNPKIAPQAAQLFKDITDQEIIDQVAKLYSQRDELLALFPTALRDQMSARLDWLDQYATDLTGKQMRMVAPKAPTWASEPEQLKAIIDSKISGSSLWSDKDQVEDAQALAWVEKNLAGNPETVVQLKLRPEAMQALEDFLKPLMPKTVSAYSAPVAKPANVLPTDNFYQPILSAVKNINYHAGDGAYNQGTVANALAKKQDLAYMAQWGTANEQAMAKQYLDVIDQIENSILAKPTGKLPVIAPFKQYEIPAAPAGPLSAVPVAGPDQFKVTAEDYANFAEKKLLKGAATQVGSVAYTATGNSVLIDMGDVTARYFPGTQRNHDYAFALKGQLELRTAGTATEETMNRLKDAFSNLGIDVTPPSDEYRQAMYLQKNMYFLNKSQVPPGLEAIMSDRAISDADRLQKVADMAKQKFGIEIKPGDERWKGELAPNGDGYRYFLRSDMTEDELNRDLKGYALIHSTSAEMSKLVSQLLDSGGQITPTTERLRKGISISKTGGQSPGPDLGTGGASYFFTRIKKTSMVNADHFYFKPEWLARLDAYSYQGDVYGNVKNPSTMQSRATTVPEYKSYSTGGGNETIFKNGFSIFDVQTIGVRDQAARDKVLDTFRKHKITVFPDGRPIEDVVKVSGSSL